MIPRCLLVGQTLSDEQYDELMTDMYRRILLRLKDSTPEERAAAEARAENWIQSM